MKPYSKEFRGEVLAACDRGRGTREVATHFKVSESWVRRVKQERRELNKLAPCLTRRRTPLWAAIADRMREVIREEPQLNPDRLVFIDETCATTNMTRPRGRAPKGERLLASVPYGHWKTTTFLAALRTTGLTAPLVVDGAINGELFLGWARLHLVPTLRPGDIVVMDLNPIDRVFSEFTWLLRSASARTVESLWSLCGELLDRFTEAECRNCFKNCDYRYT
jgi:transposase